MFLASVKVDPKGFDARLFSFAAAETFNSNSGLNSSHTHETVETMASQACFFRNVLMTPLDGLKRPLEDERCHSICIRLPTLARASTRLASRDAFPSARTAGTTPRDSLETCCDWTSCSGWRL